jgi:twitching motility protein PilT
MAAIDGLLRMLLDNGGDELKVASDAAPRMMARGGPLRLSIPPTPDETVRLLLGPILGDAEEAALAASGRHETRYAFNGVAFAVTLAKAGAGLEATFRRGDEAAAPSPPKPMAATMPKPIATPPTMIAPPTKPIAPPMPTSAPAMTAPPSMTAPPAKPSAAPMSTASTVTALDAGLEELLSQAAASGATDLHLRAGEPPIIRVDGELRALGGGAVGEEELAALSALADEARAGRSVDAAFTTREGRRVRLNLYRAGDRLAAALRLLPARTPSLAELNLPAALEDIVAAPHGLVIVCGATGSGKSATLAALAQASLRRRPGLLLTLEDPVEYTVDGGPGSLVRQREVGRDVTTFGAGLRDALREDPDLVLVGEMRDPESISLALTAAETGHLVLASLHSRSAPSAVERIIDTYAAERQRQVRVQLADALRAVVAQRLVPRARGAGRVPAVEILRATHAVTSLLREGRTEQLPSVMQAGKKDGMVTLERSLADLVRSGAVTRDAAYAVANDATSLAGYLRE